MPKNGIKINLDLLRPQSQPQQLAVKIFKWLLSSGRFLIIAVEIVVLGAFLFRFKLDADIATTREAIEEQIPFIDSLSSDEKLIRKTQFQLTTIKTTKQSSPDFAKILDNISKQTPSGVTLSTLNMGNGIGNVSLKLVASATDNTQLNSFIAGLKSTNLFSDLTLADVSFKSGLINFTLTSSIVGSIGSERKL